MTLAPVKTEELPLFEEILLNPSVPADEELRLSVQALKIWGIFRRGLPVFTSQLSKVACQYNARLNEVRQALMKFDLTIDLTHKSRFGNNTYEIVRFQGSKYQKHLREIGKE